MRWTDGSFGSVSAGQPKRAKHGKGATDHAQKLYEVQAVRVSYWMGWMEEGNVAEDGRKFDDVV